MRYEPQKGWVQNLFQIPFLNPNPHYPYKTELFSQKKLKLFLFRSSMG